MSSYFKYIFLLIGTCVALPSFGQKTDEALRYADGLAPYTALYYLRDIQQTHPEDERIYLKLGDISYQLLPTRDPILEYEGLKELCHSTRLYYGNCLHFAKDKSKYGSLYGRMDIARSVGEQADSIYVRFNRMVKDYNDCCRLFTALMANHTREKTAHLMLSTEDEALLDSIHTIAQRLPKDIQDYVSIQTYRTTRFKWIPIELYRLDGLTYSDFLASEVTLWDYRTWVENFRNLHQTTYLQLYKDMETGPITNRLLNRMAQADFGSAMRDWFYIRQQRNTIQESLSGLQATDSILNSESLMRLLIQADRYRNALRLCEQALQCFEQKMDTATFQRYRPFLDAEHIQSEVEVRQLAHEDYREVQVAYDAYCTRLLALGTTYVNTLTAEQQEDAGLLTGQQDCVLAMPISSHQIAFLRDAEGANSIEIRNIE